MATDVTVSGSRVQFGGSVSGTLDLGAPTTPISRGTLGASFTAFADLQ